MRRSTLDPSGSTRAATRTEPQPIPVPESREERRRNLQLRAVVDRAAPPTLGAGPADAEQPPAVRRRSRAAAPDPRSELREQLRRLEGIRPRGTALTALTRREPLGWHAVLNGPGYGATGVGETPPAAIAHLVYLLGGGE